MLSNLDDAIQFLRRFHSTALADMHELKVDDPSIPAALRKVYAAFGDPSAPSCVIAGQDSLLPPTQLRRTGDFVVFLHENQGCWSGAYRAEGDMDSGVYLFEDSKEPGKNFRHAGAVSRHLPP